MPDLSYSDLPVDGEANNAADVITPLNDIKTYVNGDGWVDADRLDATVAANLGLSDGTDTRRGKCIIATEESRTNTAFGTMTTPDQVSGITVPTDGLIFVLFRAHWRNGAAGTAEAAIFLNDEQLKVPQANGAPVVSGGSFSGLTLGYGHLISGEPSTSSTSTLYTETAGAYFALDVSDVTTGQAVVSTATSGGRGSIIPIEVAAGTYDVSVRFKASTGSVYVKNRKLKVWTMGF